MNSDEHVILVDRAVHHSERLELFIGAKTPRGFNHTCTVIIGTRGSDCFSCKWLLTCLYDRIRYCPLSVGKAHSATYSMDGSAASAGGAGGPAGLTGDDA